MAPIVEALKNIGITQLGEGPHWDADRQTLYFVDIPGKSIHRYVPATKEHTSVNLDVSPHFIIPVKGQKNKFVISQKNEIVLITWDGTSDKISDVQKLAQVDEPSHAINDAKADLTGRLWTGTVTKFGETISSFVSFENGNVTTHVTEVGLSNGIAFNTALKKLYYVDTNKKTVDQFDFDLSKGSISNRQVIFTLEKNNVPGFPDGMTIDTDGNLWVAIFDGSSVIKVDPRKPETLLETINLPAQEITSVTFGGPNLDELYVTSGKMTLDKEVRKFTESDGLLFKVTGLNAKGHLAHSVVL